MQVKATPSAQKRAGPFIFVSSPRGIGPQALAMISFKVVADGASRNRKFYSSRRLLSVFGVINPTRSTLAALPMSITSAT